MKVIVRRQKTEDKLFTPLSVSRQTSPLKEENKGKPVASHEGWLMAQ